LSLVDLLSSQTHFTLPKNVWRISIDQYSSKDKWIGKGGTEGFPNEYLFIENYLFGTDSINIDGLLTNSLNRRKEKAISYNIEYGLSDRFTFFLDIPYFSVFSEETSWGWINTSDSLLSNEDTVETAINSLMEYYHPERSTSGLGDICWGFNSLLFGSPAWEGESMMSIYGSIGMQLPTARVIDEFNGAKVDSMGRPVQFNQLPMGDGVTQWKVSFFGEFYHEILKRLIRINWQVQYRYYVEGKFWTRITPRGIFTVNHDMVLQELGKVYRLKLGDVVTTKIEGFLEVIPDRISINIGQRWLFKRRDRYTSINTVWNEWMEGGTDLHKDYDTRALQIIQSISFLFHNIHPLKRIGPLPFELKTQMDLPFLTRYSWNRAAFSISLSMYFQLW